MIRNTVFLFAVVFSSAAASSLIDKWGRCKITDAHLNDCLSKACTNMLIDLRTGNAEHGIPTFEPFIVKKLVLRSGGKSPVNLAIDLENCAYYRLTEFSELTVDASQLKDMGFKISMLVPDSNATCKYSMSGQMLALPIKGAGMYTLIMKQMKFEIIMKGKPLDKGGKLYWNIDEFKTIFEPTDAIVEFTNLFNGNKKLGDTANKLFNENWKLVYNEFRPQITGTFAKTAIDVAKIIAQLEPFDEMFPK